MTTFRSALDELARAQKPAKGISVYSRFVNRPLGRILAAGLHRAGASPNQVTLLSATSTAAALAVLITSEPSVLVGILVAALLVLGFALDSADGQVARLSGRSSPAGEWLDHVIDAAKMVAVHGAVLIALWRNPPAEDMWLLAPLAFQLIATLIFAGGTLTDLISRALPAGRVPDRGPASQLRSLALLPADFGILALTFVLWGRQEIFLYAYVALLAVNAILAGLLLAKWFRQLSRA